MLIISIVDDNPKDAAALSSLAAAYFQKTGTAYVERRFSSGSEFIRSSENSNIVFMEFQMDRLNGLETARILRKLGSDAQLIFVTRTPEMAIHGYEVDALDFIGKPASQKAIDFALNKAMRHLQYRSSVTLALKLSNGTASISSNDIMFVEVFDHNLVYHTVKGEYNVRGRLSDVYDQLDHERFILCNRSFIVNLWYVSGIYSDYVMVDNVKITVSKSHRGEILDRFSSFLDLRKKSSDNG